MNEEQKMRYLQMMEKHNLRVAELEEQIHQQERIAQHYSNEYKRISYNLDNPEVILKSLSEEFKKNTNLNAPDMLFIFFATSLQCTRWLFQPHINTQFEQISRENRHDSRRDGAIEFKKGNEIADKNSNGVIKSRKYPDKETMFRKAVPYDVMKGTESVVIPGVSERGTNLSGVNHHTATLGHDPVLGYIFGTINIMTNTVTFKNNSLQTHIVRTKQGTLHDQYMDNRISIFDAFNRAMESAKEDIGRVPAAITRQALHIQSDKYTKLGLPIPMINPEKAQELLQKGWNSNEMERFAAHIGKNIATISYQAFLCEMINVIIETLYLLTHMDMDYKLCQVKAKKVILYSDIMASTSNIIFSSITMNENLLDIGGFLVTIRRLITDREFIRKIRDEYVYGGYEKSLRLQEFKE